MGADAPKRFIAAAKTDPNALAKAVLSYYQATGAPACTIEAVNAYAAFIALRGAAKVQEAFLAGGVSIPAAIMAQDLPAEEKRHRRILTSITLYFPEERGGGGDEGVGG